VFFKDFILYRLPLSLTSFCYEDGGCQKRKSLAGTLHQVASLKGKQSLTPEPKKLELTQSILETTVADGSFNLPSLEIQLPELYISAPVISAEANTIVTT